MNENKIEVDNHIASLSEIGQDWMNFFVQYMRQKHPDLEEVISFQMPTYKLGTGKLRNYIAFSTAKSHFSMHSMDFEYITMLQDKLSCPGRGKGCVKVKYTNIDERKILLEAIEDIIERKISAIYGK